MQIQSLSNCLINKRTLVPKLQKRLGVSVENRSNLQYNLMVLTLIKYEKNQDVNELPNRFRSYCFILV